MIAFYLVIFLALVTLFFLLAFIYKPLGKIVYKIFKDAMDEINDEEKENQK